MSDKDESKQVVVKQETMVNSPYALYSSDNPGAMITSVKLKGDNYNEWAMEMMNALRAKKKNGFIDGTLPKPSGDSPDLEPWLSVNSMIVGWIRSSIEPRVRSTVTFITEANKLWENLKKRFEVGNKVRIHQLMEQLASCRQNGEAVIDYYGRLAMMSEELQTYKPPPACSCLAAATYEKEREDERVHQFIMGLDDAKFGNVVTAIIEADELPDLGKVYAKVIREEARLNAAKAREAVSQEAVGFAARRDTEENTDRRDSRDGRDAARAESNSSSYENRARDRGCSNCGKTGHEKSTCWQLIGYPEWMNEKCGGRGSGRGRGSSRRGGGRSSANTAHATSSHGSSNNDLTPEQWKAITQIINDGKSRGQSERLSSKSLGNVIIDSGASHHMNLCKASGGCVHEGAWEDSV